MNWKKDPLYLNMHFNTSLQLTLLIPAQVCVASPVKNYILYVFHKIEILLNV